MVFKGARGRDARGIAEAIEDVGGSLNAWTARDQTVFHARTLAPDVGLGLELIADLVRAPKLDEDELEREKLVILSELGECLDAPDDLIKTICSRGCDTLAAPCSARTDHQRHSRSDARAGWPSSTPRALVISARAGHPVNILNLAESFVRRPGSAPHADRPAPSTAAKARTSARRADPSRFRYRGLASEDPRRAGAVDVRAGGRRRCRRDCYSNCARIAGWLFDLPWTPGVRRTGCSSQYVDDKARAAEALALVACASSRSRDLSEAEVKLHLAK